MNRLVSGGEFGKLLIVHKISVVLPQVTRSFHKHTKKYVYIPDNYKNIARGTTDPGY